MINHGIIIIKIVGNNVKNFHPKKFYENTILILMGNIFGCNYMCCPAQGAQWINRQLTHGDAVGWVITGFQSGENQQFCFISKFSATLKEHRNNKKCVDLKAMPLSIN